MRVLGLEDACILVAISRCITSDIDFIRRETDRILGFSGSGSQLRQADRRGHERGFASLAIDVTRLKETENAQ